ncbi:MAG: DUF1385 domain-containing protein, partial [Anaerolineales bacterium]|nr:DUF1385 domain-containing protein [Anaerolineales bacterium]MDW8448303.1 DUF1385 domain-containing protein [Anaerolineales bacterium]
MDKLRMPTYGGQAVIEGVMMRGRNAVAIALRAPNREIVIHAEPLGSIYRSRWMKIPFLRGVLSLWDALSLGMRALTLSANLQSGESEKLEGAPLYLTLSASLAIAIGLFFLVPAFLGQLGERVLQLNAWQGSFAEGLTRLALLVGYIVAVGRIPEIRRVFAYHGAEHKTINAFEAGAELTPQEVARFPLEHPRCGTSFLLTLVVLSILVFSLLGPLELHMRLITRILMIPVLAAIAYEYIRWTAAHVQNPWVRWMIAPNLALQRL